MPISPEPGSTNRPSSVITLVFGPGRNDAVDVTPSRLDVADASPGASDEPSESSNDSVGLYSRRRRLVASLHITPDEKMARRLSSVHRPGWASRAARIGLAKASPTMAND